jgi:hypothetical protein
MNIINNELGSDVSRINMLKIQKMIFISNALENGWTAKQITPNKYEFTNTNTNTIKEVNLENYLKHFIKNNISIDNLLPNRPNRRFSE